MPEAPIKLDDDVKLKTITGTPYYIAPCMVRGENYGTKVDLWAIGCIAYQLVYGVTPFHHSTSFMDLYKNIVEGNWTFPEDATGSEQFRDLVTKLLAPSPTDRLSATEALQHTFFTTASPNTKRQSGAFVCFSTETGELHWDPLQNVANWDDSGSTTLGGSTGAGAPVFRSDSGSTTE